MINKLDNNPILSNFIEDSCSENGICVTFEEGIPEDSYRILKVDEYYNSLNIENRPASVDCLIITKCIEEGYGLTLVELKNINNSRGFTVNNLKEKFETSLFRFINNDFHDTLSINYERIDLFFVSKKELYNRDLGLKMEMLMNVRFKFQGKTLMIKPKMPTPTIKNCYSRKSK